MSRQVHRQFAEADRQHRAGHEERPAPRVVHVTVPAGGGSPVLAELAEMVTALAASARAQLAEMVAEVSAAASARLAEGLFGRPR